MLIHKEDHRVHPVLGYDDNLVVALHHCAKCPNRGVPIEEIVADLGDGLPNNAISNCEDEVAIIENVLSGSTDNQQASTSITASNVIEKWKQQRIIQQVKV